eukprot:gene30054-30548_t
MIEYPVASVLLHNEENLTLAIGSRLFLFNQRYLWGDFAATAVLAGLPLTVLFLVTQRWLTSGLTAGAGAAQAQFSTSGYFRAGTISSGARTTQCYGLGNSESGGGTFRLGNECDVFGEIDLSNKIKVGDLDVTAHLMPGYYSNATTDSSPN